MSLKGLRPNHFPNSAKEWARIAIGAPKIVGDEGFENFRSGSWYHPMHYSQINQTCPSVSPPEAAEEMRDYRMKLVEDITSAAEELDSMVMRLAKMEEEIKTVIEKNEI